MIWRILAILIIFLLVTDQAQAPVGLLQFASSAVNISSDVTCNAVTGLYTSLSSGSGTCTAARATCDGNAAHDDAPAFVAINTWAIAWSAAHPGQKIEVDIPHLDANSAVSKCMFIGNGNCAGTSATNIGDGVILPSSILVNALGATTPGSGATFTDNTTGKGYLFGACGHGAGLTGGQCFIGIADINGCTSRIATVAAGATCVNLIVGDSGQSLATLIARFTVGTYAMVSGVDLQGGGAPANNYFFEYQKIASKSTSLQCDAVTAGASVTFTAPLAFGYKSTWPLFAHGSSVDGDQGGPATIWQLNPNWPTNQEYRGITFDFHGAGSGLIGQGHTIVFRNASWTGDTRCFIPSQNLNWSVINSDMNTLHCQLEIDKLNGTVTFDNTTVWEIDAQSSSVRTFNLINGTYVTHQMVGTLDKTVCTNSRIADIGLGAFAYGLSTEFDGTNCQIDLLEVSGFQTNWLGTNSLMSGGVITQPNVDPVTARGAGAAGLVRMTLNCNSLYPTCIPPGTPTSVMQTGQSVFFQATSAPCSADVPNGNYVINVIDSTHIDLQGTTYTSGTTVAAGCQAYGYNGFAQLSWAVPGGNVVWDGSHQLGPPVCQIADMTQDANATYITFSGDSRCLGGFPHPPGGAAGSSLMTHPAPVFNCTGCTGDVQLSFLSGAPANGAYGSYWRGTLNSGTPFVTNAYVWGALSNLTFNVTSSAGGGQTVDINNPLVVDVPGTSLTNFGPSESTSTVHSCSITASTSTCTTGSPGAIWFVTGQVTPELTGGTAGSVTVTIQTNQHVVAGP